MFAHKEVIHEEVHHGSTLLERLAPFLCELIGTFMLTLTVGLCSIFGDPAFNATAIGMCLMALIYSTGPISGGQLNPAVCLTLAFLGKLKYPLAIAFMIFEFAGGLLAALVISVVFGEGLYVRPGESFGMFSACICEIFYSGLLCFVVANCAASVRNNPKSDPNQFYAIAIGFVIIAGGYACGPISGAFFNPAVAVGFGLVEGLIYALYHVVGAMFAALLYRVVRPEDFGHDAASESLILEAVESSLEARGLSEFLGTFTVVLTFGLNAIIGVSPAVGGWSVGAALTCLIYSLANVSGAHFNPAVSLAICLAGRKKIVGRDAAFYCLCQVSAALIAGFALAYVHAQGSRQHEILGVAPQPGQSWTQVGFAEIVFTALLCWTVLAVSTTSLTYPGSAELPRRNFYFALAIGASVVAAGFAIGAISGGLINPAIAVGMAVESSAEDSTSSSIEILKMVNMTNGTAYPISVEHWTPNTSNFLWYILYQFGGGAIAALMFHCTHAHEFYSKNAHYA